MIKSNPRLSPQSQREIIQNDCDILQQMLQQEAIATNNKNALPGGADFDAKAIYKQHYGELSVQEKYLYDLSRAQLKASSRTSALLAGFAMVALVELQYTETTPRPLLIILAVVTTLLVSVHLLALMMSTCILPYIEANGCTKDSPHKRLKFYIELSWFFSTCIGLLLFLVEIEVILFVKFDAVHYLPAAYITAAILVPVFVIFIVFSCLIHKNRMSHSMERAHSKMDGIEQYVHDAESDQFVGNPLLRGDMSRQMFDISPNSSIHHDLQSQGEMVEMKNVVKVV
uniref:Calcium release-activated calcium channel protein 1 n=1 Tax=Rhabditophanes sp. KR3021 TaxID=114890 RepID=A0AC35TJI4_9BILA